MIDYNKIFAAHYRARLPVMLWGASGYGKSTLVANFAKKHGMNLEVLHAQYLDPLSLFIPSTSDMREMGYAKFYPSDLVHKILHAKEKTVLFLDELTRAREETFNILTELLLERKVFGYALPSHVMIVAASNFAEEDTGVKDLPDAVLQRLTHIIHAPEPQEALAKLKNPLAQRALMGGRNLIAKASSYPILDRLRASPRQIDACGSLAEAGLVEGELLAVCQGRIGIEAGAEFSFALNRAMAGGRSPFPNKLEASNMLSLAQFEETGAVLEVVEFLRLQSGFPERQMHVASYLLFHARPETCRALQMSRFQYVYENPPVSSEGRPLHFQETPGIKNSVKGGKPWQWYATKLGKIKSR
ncbi:MAG: AAA family ATPase [Proteobacteria bacterium]|nr:MAG: AAA family ATPase [Pseudomonadota bacterium]